VPRPEMVDMACLRGGVMSEAVRAPGGPRSSSTESRRRRRCPAEAGAPECCYFRLAELGKPQIVLMVVVGVTIRNRSADGSAVKAPEPFGNVARQVLLSAINL
jgi:hypothetical protein